MGSKETEASSGGEGWREILQLIQNSYQEIVD